MGIAIVTILVIVISSYYQSYYEELQQQLEGQSRSEQNNPINNNTKKLLFIFDINNNINLPRWCNDISSLINNYELKGAVFITGKIAKENPECVTNFSFNNSDTDIGSQTYDYVNLASIQNSTEKLNEIFNAKWSIDNIGRLSSALFKAPYGSVSNDINSLLIKSGIIADFSKNHTYSKFEDGEFQENDIILYNGSNISSNIQFVKSLSLTNLTMPIMIEFNNSFPIDEIDKLLTKITSDYDNIQFVNPSEITGKDLTIRID